MDDKQRIGLFQDSEIKRVVFGDVFNIDEIQSRQDVFSAAAGVAGLIAKPDSTVITRPSGMAIPEGPVLENTCDFELHVRFVVDHEHVGTWFIKRSKGFGPDIGEERFEQVSVLLKSIINDLCEKAYFQLQLKIQASNILANNTLSVS